MIVLLFVSHTHIFHRETLRRQAAAIHPSRTSVYHPRISAILRLRLDKSNLDVSRTGTLERTRGGMWDFADPLDTIAIQRHISIIYRGGGQCVRDQSASVAEPQPH